MTARTAARKRRSRRKEWVRPAYKPEPFDLTPVLEAVIARAIDSFPSPFRPKFPPPAPPPRSPLWEVVAFRLNDCVHVHVAPPNERAHLTINECLGCGQDGHYTFGVCGDCSKQRHLFFWPVMD